MKQVQTWGWGGTQRRPGGHDGGSLNTRHSECPAWAGWMGWFTHTRHVPTKQGVGLRAGQARRGGKPRLAWGPWVWGPRGVWAPGLCRPFLPNKRGSSWGPCSVPACQAGHHTQGPAVSHSGQSPSGRTSRANLHPGPEAWSSPKCAVLLQAPRACGICLMSGSHT